MKRSLIALATVLTAALCAALPLTWRADWPDAKPVETLVHRGTDIELQPSWFINKTAADTNGWTFTTFCQTNAVGPWFGPLPGAFFSHTNDVGAAFYNVMVRASAPGGAVNYTAFARLRMLDSPGFAPGELPLPVPFIDFSKVVALNAPWLLPGATNDIGTIKGELGSISNSVSTLSAATATNSADIANLSDTTATINSKIPSAASALNQLADKAWIDAAISTLSDSISTLNDTKADETTPVVQPPSLPADCLPITGTYYGSDFSLSTVYIQDTGDTQYYAYGTDVGGNTVTFALFDKTTGKYKSSYYGIDALKFNGGAPTVNSWPVLNLVATGGTVVRSAEFSDALGKKVDVANAEVDNKLLIYGGDGGSDWGYPVEIIADYTNGVVTPTIVSRDGQTSKRYSFPVPDYQHGQTTLDGTLALTSDIPTVPTAQINAATTTNALQDAAIAEKQDKLPYPTNSIPYAALSNKPQINGHTLSGNQTGAALGLADETTPVVQPPSLSADLFPIVYQNQFGDTLTIESMADVVFEHPGGAYPYELYKSGFYSRICGFQENGVFAGNGGGTVATFNGRDGESYIWPTLTLSATGGSVVRSTDLVAVALAATNYTNASISPTSPAFSNAVLSVGLGIDTNTVAVINELVDSAHDLPVSGATSVGALLLALAAAVAALKGNKADKPTNPTNGNLVKVSGTGELQDAGYHFEVRNGVPCIVQYA